MHALDWLRDSSRRTDPAGLRRLRDGHLPDPRVDHGVSRAVFPEADDEAAVSRFPGPQTELAGVLDELFTLPFFSRRRLVIVEEADTFVTKHRKDLEAYVQKPSASGTLLLQVKQWPATTNLAKLVEKVGLAIECTALPEKDTAKVVAWLTQYARSRCDAQLEQAAANLLVELVGLEVGILASEVEKLAVYAGDSKRIERAMSPEWWGPAGSRRSGRPSTRPRPARAGGAGAARQPPGGRRDPRRAARRDECLVAQGPSCRPASRRAA